MPVSWGRKGRACPHLMACAYRCTAGAAAVTASWIVAQRGEGVPTVPHEKDKARFAGLHQGPHVTDAPKAVARPGEAQGHSEALKPRIPGAN